ncbi:MAG: peptidase S8, partial [Actinomycetia bacterium]|nr:peptidase S8 [Actinomycetes bacterium]
MKSRVTPYARLAGIVAAGMFAVAAMAGAAPSASASAEPASTPVTYPVVDGATWSYVVNARQLTPGQQMLVENAVRDAGGTIVMSYQEIGV